MRDLPPGWETDICVLRHSGSVIEEHADHLVIRSPKSPEFHWGNCLFVLDEGTVDDAARWVGAFREAFPLAGWIALGLPRMPADTDAWAGKGVDLELSDVLTTGTLPRQTAPPAGYAFRRLEGADWSAYLGRALADNDRTGEYEPVSHARFAENQALVRQAMSERGVAAFFGAFDDAALVADLGIVLCGTTARYQSVGTDEDHRAHGLASHLLGLAALWAAGKGSDRWVIVTGSTNPAGRVYRRAGFEPDVGNVQAYRKPIPDEGPS